MSACELLVQAAWLLSGAYLRRGDNPRRQAISRARANLLVTGSVSRRLLWKLHRLEKLGRCGVLQKANPVVVSHGFLRQFAAVVRGRVPYPMALPQMQMDFRRTTVEPLTRRTSVDHDRLLSFMRDLEKRRQIAFELSGPGARAIESKQHDCPLLGSRPSPSDQA